MGIKIGLGRIWSFVFGFWSLVARLVSFERGGTKPEGEMESVNSLRISAPPWWPLREGRDGKCEGRNEECEFLARESVSSSPIVRIFGKGKCKFIANFSATMVTSLPSLCLYLSLSHRKYLTHNIGSASALPILCVRYFRWERERDGSEWDGSDVTTAALKLAMNLHFPLPKSRTIGDEFTLSLAQNSHFSFLPSHFSSLPPLRGHHCGAEIRNEFTLSIAKKFFALFVPPLSNGTSRATSESQWKNESN